MLFYNFQISFDSRDSKANTNFEGKRAERMRLGELSSALSEGIDGERVRVLIHRFRQNVFQMLASVDGFKEMTAAQLTKLLEKFFADRSEFGIKNVTVKAFTEITAKKFSRIFDRANRDDNFNFDYYQLNQDLGLDCLDNRTFKLSETICDDKRLSFDAANAKAEKLLADETFKDEFRRIYSKENAHHFYGQPVHYKITAGNTKAAMSLSTLLIVMYWPSLWR